MPETQGSGSLPGILATIVRTKERELDRLRPNAAEIERRAAEAPVPRDFEEALRRPDRVALIAECKRRSPGAGDIRPGLDPAALTRSYEDAGAAALSVLTDGEYFGGSTDDLIAVKAATRIPVLRKDFTLDPLQVVEARAVGADAVLLIVRILPDAMLRTLLREVAARGMTALVETHDLGEVRRALAAGARVIGINNRDLSTFKSDLETTSRLLEEIPPDVTVVSESGIRDRGDVERLGASGVHAVLVGEALLASADPGRAAASLVGVPRRERSGG
ncbi:MAG: indole-3-glycerol phosphate synthase TrpC [Gemmatimonadetes bacterium]|nr:indole-3-glycerol phosphate synthase TrpC [Gemmatimonadota bacterium]